MAPTKVSDKLLAWGIEGIEPATLEQAERTARMPFVHSHVALMPDAHVGFGSTVGSVFATSGAIIPSAIGVDIGCGMVATRLAVATDRNLSRPLTANDLPDSLGRLHGMLRAAIPAGVGKGHDRDTAAKPSARLFGLSALPHPVKDTRLLNKALEQYGSLGSGNHFVELCLDENDNAWFVLHSGSRGVGNELATLHIDKAKGLMKARFIELEDPDLAYLVEGEESFKAYIYDMLWAQDYARENRAAMVEAALRELRAFLDRDVIVIEQINCHHNFTQREHHMGRNLWVTRKGAIKADSGDRGVIPGSMGTRSYIVTGLGNAASFASCSHGAGRRLSRGAARKQLSIDSLREAMAGKTWNDREADSLVDEHPDAYKSIDDVMEAQQDLVRVDHVLRQILNMKGAK